MWPFDTTTVRNSRSVGQKGRGVYKPRKQHKTRGAWDTIGRVVAEEINWGCTKFLGESSKSSVSRANLTAEERIKVASAQARSAREPGLTDAPEQHQSLEIGGESTQSGFIVCDVHQITNPRAVRARLSERRSPGALASS